MARRDDDGDGEATRIQRLLRRVHWLDRYRRMLSVVCAFIVAPLSILRFADDLGSDWPEVHEAMLMIVVGMIAWWLAEVALAWLAAFWETEHDQLMRDRGLPRAVLRRR